MQYSECTKLAAAVALEICNSIRYLFLLLVRDMIG